MKKPQPSEAAGPPVGGGGGLSPSGQNGKGRKINILFIIPSLGTGGAERQVVDLINGLSRDRFNLFLFTFGNRLDLLESLDRDRLGFYHHPRRNKLDLSAVGEIAAIIKREKIDIVHATLQIAVLFGLLGKVWALRKVKLVSALHTTLNISRRGDLFDRFVYAPVMFFCHRIITVCRNQQAYWSRKHPRLSKKFMTIYNGIDSDKFRDTLSAAEKRALRTSLGIRAGEFVAAVVAMLKPGKGHEYAFQAVRALNDGGTGLKLLLIGDGDSRRELEALSEKLSLSKNLVWLGYQKDPRPFLSLSDVILVPSVAESFPMAILEALSMGKPVIASRVGGNSEVIKDGENGFLVPARDVESLAEKVRILQEDAGLRERLSRQARESVKQFSLAEMVARTESFLTGLIDWTPDFKV